MYQVYPASFQDSTGTGVGDLKGIISRVDYLNDLGVDIVWLSPIFKSPQIDMVSAHLIIPHAPISWLTLILRHRAMILVTTRSLTPPMEIFQMWMS